MNAATTIKVWDPLVRIFHWLLASAFFVAYITGIIGEGWQQIHNIAGYLIISVVIGRILWGFIGSPNAQFKDFMVGPAKVIHYLKAMLNRQHPRYIGHNPAGAVMILLLLISIIAISFTGLILVGIDEHTGPLAAWVQSMGWHDDEIFEELHEFFSNFTLLLIFFHVSGVIVESLMHKENLIKAMITGRKSKNP